jgi:tRNA 2-thiouridine synthesizing protein A
MTTLQENKTLDCSGMLCPMPVIKTSKTIKELQLGQILKMIATDPGAPADMEAWARQTGNELLDSHKEGEKFIFYLKRAK